MWPFKTGYMTDLHFDAAGVGAATSALGYIKSAEQLKQGDTSLRRLLVADLGTQTMAARLAPVQFDDDTVAVFGLQEHIQSDQADELLQRLISRSFSIHAPARFVLPAPLLLALSRDGAHTDVVSRTFRHSELSRAFEDIVRWALLHGASDIHFNVMLEQSVSSIRFTVAGLYLSPAAYQHLSTSLLMDILAVVWMDIEGGSGAVFDPYSEQQGRYALEVDGRKLQLRWASLAADTGPSVCMRILELEQAQTVPDLHALGYVPEQLAQFQRLMQAQGGAIVLAGPVGAGKSTTLAALMQLIPAHRKIITLEDPVEYRISQAVQNSIGRRLDKSAHEAFASKLRALKRSAMQDVLLGEVRDQETGRAFMDLAGAGLNVYTTVHAGSAAGIAERLASDFIGVSRDFLAMPGMLKLLVYQVLLPRLCSHCALDVDQYASQSGQPSQDWGNVAARLDQDLAAWRFPNRQGCEHCQLHGLPERYGYQGLQVVAELLEPGLVLQACERIRHAQPLCTHTDLFPPVLKHALLHVAAGRLTIADVQARFGTIETFVLAHAARQGKA